MESCAVWTVIVISILGRINALLPIPLVILEERIELNAETKVSCVLPASECHCLEVELKIISKEKLKNCVSHKGTNANVTCALDVTKDTSGVEVSCEAHFKTKSKPYKLNIQTEPEFTDCPDKLVWLEGQEDSFQCQASGYPPPTVTCEKNNTIYKVGETFTPTRNMSGDYTCRATNFDTHTKRVSVSIEYIPTILSIRESSHLRAMGDKVEITCTADGLPDPTYRWRTPTSDLHFSPDNRTVTIQSLQRSHLGSYECIAQNKHGTGTMGKPLELAVKSSISELTINPSEQVLEGQNVTVTCKAEGFPSPVLNWSIPSHDVEISKDKTTVRIWGVKKGHVGSYRCTSQNVHGTDTRSIALSLGVKARIVQIKVQPSKSVEEGANVTLTCVADGVPPPTYTWVPPTTEVQLSSDRSTLTIWGATRIHHGSYQCKAENKHGADWRTETISVKAQSKGSGVERRCPASAIILVGLICTSACYHLS